MKDDQFDICACDVARNRAALQAKAQTEAPEGGGQSAPPARSYSRLHRADSATGLLLCESKTASKGDELAEHIAPSHARRHSKLPMASTPGLRQATLTGVVHMAGPLK